MQDLMPPINTPDSAFHDGDPTTGQLGTIVTALWLNNVQAATRDVQLEIKNVLAKAGIQPDPKKTNQLAEAISQIIGSGNYASTAYVDNGLNKKIDKANISGVKGNDNDKVPSLNLFTIEIGKLAAIGYSYSKIESDNRYQPKGEYATSQALSDGLIKKFDKTGGEIDGPLKIKNARIIVGGVNDFAGAALTRTDGSYILLESRPLSNNALLGIIDRSASGSDRTVVSIPNRSGTAMLVGDYGWGGSADNNLTASQAGITEFLQTKTTPSQMHRNNITTKYSVAYAANAYLKCGNTWMNISVGHNNGIMTIAAGNETVENVSTVYSTVNTTTDRNGNLKVSGFSDTLSDYPVGSPIPWPQATAPSGFLVCNGQSFNKTTYPLLAAAYPSGKLPDLRGEFIRGLDAGRNVDSSRAVLSAQSDAMQEISGTFTVEGAKSEKEAPAVVTGVFTKSVTKGKVNTAASSQNEDIPLIKFNTSNEARTSNENRPRNIAFLYIVRAA
ncbi:phage tail protein [Providencia rettgeri]|uniref:Tail fiber protein n=1 Tax=Providencia rettgeri TaxID=587 RepID=A0AAD2VUI8_PRORE|nr:tail fiber protein [Providencia rettgeri]